MQHPRFVRSGGGGGGVAAGGMVEGGSDARRNNMHALGVMLTQYGQNFSDGHWENDVNTI